MKNQVDILDATPRKRFILSIVADYDLTKSICELIDNSIDIWLKNNSKDELLINLEFNQFQKTITILDNAGGIKERELEYLVSPGATTNLPEETSIGIFGVGTKRAVIALAEVVRIHSRYKKSKTYAIEFDQHWLREEDWHLPYYEVDNIVEGCTKIELEKLRVNIDTNEIQNLSRNLSVIYAKYISSKNIGIQIDGIKLMPIVFDNWAFPPGFEPKKYSGSINTLDGRKVNVETIAGLTTESSPTSGDYGVYFYCNDRLIVEKLKTPEVGFVKGIAGAPDASLSITRIIVSFTGAAVDMPWNSSKSNININHIVFNAFRLWLLEIVKNYCSLSRRLKGNWPEAVFKYDTGTIEEVHIPDFNVTSRSYLPELPSVNIRYADQVKHKNAAIEKQKPWTKGLYESVVAVEHISKQKLDTKNRIALILLDSTLEIAFKEYLVNDSEKHYRNEELVELFARRHLVVREMKKYINVNVISEAEWKKINYYYDLRCKLVHERATAQILDSQIKDQRKLVEKVLKKLFKLKFN